MPTGYEVDTYRNIARIAKSLDRIAAAVEPRSEVIDPDLLARAVNVMQGGDADAPEVVLGELLDALGVPYVAHWQES